MANKIIIHEEGAANQYTILGDKTWIMTIQMNGEYTVEQQRKILEKMIKTIK